MGDTPPSRRQPSVAHSPDARPAGDSSRSLEPPLERAEVEERNPGPWTAERAQAEFGEAVHSLLGVADSLVRIGQNLPPPGDLNDRQEHRKPFDVATEVHTTIECVLEDSLRPAIRGLQRAAQITNAELEREFLDREGGRSRKGAERARSPVTSASSPTESNTAKTIAEHEMQQVERANATGKQPVVFVYGIWLVPSSWDRWATIFEDAGYTALIPGWPDDPETVKEANQHPEVFAHEGQPDNLSNCWAGLVRNLKAAAPHPDAAAARSRCSSPDGPGRVQIPASRAASAFAQGFRRAWSANSRGRCAVSRGPRGLRGHCPGRGFPVSSSMARF